MRDSRKTDRDRGEAGSRIRRILAMLGAAALLAAASVVAEPETEAPETSPAGEIVGNAEAQPDTAAEEDDRVFTFSLIGDCTVGEDVRHQGYRSGYTYKVSQVGLDYPFSLVADMFARDDLTVANCEGTLSNYKQTKKSIMALIAPPEFAQVFKLGNVDVCNLANNHTRDFGKRGQEDTAANLGALGIASFYDDITCSVTVKGVKVGFVGFTYPMNEQKLKRYKTALENLRADGCTFVVASAHWGRETYYDLDSNQAYGVKLIDAGFDMVFGHGSHTCEMIRWYKGKVIFYSLSNFTFGANGHPKDDDTVVVQISYDIREDGTMTPREMNAIPFKMHRDGDFRPWPIEDEEGRMRVWEKLYYNGYTKHKKKPAPSLPESFLTTGYVDFRTLPVTEE